MNISALRNAYRFKIKEFIDSRSIFQVVFTTNDLFPLPSGLNDLTQSRILNHEHQHEQQRIEDLQSKEEVLIAKFMIQESSFDPPHKGHLATTYYSDMQFASHPHARKGIFPTLYLLPIDETLFEKGQTSITTATPECTTSEPQTKIDENNTEQQPPVSASYEDRLIMIEQLIKQAKCSLIHEGAKHFIVGLIKKPYKRLSNYESQKLTATTVRDYLSSLSHSPGKRNPGIRLNLSNRDYMLLVQRQNYPTISLMTKELEELVRAPNCELYSVLREARDAEMPKQMKLKRQIGAKTASEIFPQRLSRYVKNSKRDHNWTRTKFGLLDKYDVNADEIKDCISATRFKSQTGKKKKKKQLIFNLSGNPRSPKPVTFDWESVMIPETAEYIKREKLYGYEPPRGKAQSPLETTKSTDIAETTEHT